MLDVAWINRCDAPVWLLRQDMRALCLPRLVDLITANFDTINHLTSPADLRQAVRCISKNLRTGGFFLFDFLTHCQPLTHARSYVRRYLNGRSEMQQWLRWDETSRVLSIRIVHRSATMVPPAVELHSERAYTPEEMGKALLKAGFIIRGVHDAWTLRPTFSCAPRLLVVAQKRTREPVLESHDDA
jgi:hypothetical protein